MNAVTNPFELITNDKGLSTVLSIKSKLTMLIIQMIRSNEWTQKQVATKLRITQPRVSNLMQGQLTKFTIDTLISICVNLGVDIEQEFDTEYGLNICLSID